jgi:hypothetical protein
MFIGAKLLFNWHKFWSYFYKVIVKDCIDSTERERIYQKICCHENKMESLRLDS